MMQSQQSCITIVGRATGLSLGLLDLSSGRLELGAGREHVNHAVAIVASASGSHLYATNLGRHGSPDGISAFRIERDPLRLRPLKGVRSVGTLPCHLAIADDGRSLLVAAYDSGSLSTVALAADGSLARPVTLLRFPGRVSGDDLLPSRAHCAVLDPSGRFVLVADLGADRVWIVPRDVRSGELQGEPTFTQMPAGEGPRFLARHPNGRWLYAGCETGNSVGRFDWDDKAGSLTLRTSVSTLPPGYAGANTTSEMHLHPSARFLYVANRGHDSIACFAIDDGSGDLGLIAHVPTLGRTPRSFHIDPTGQWLMLVNSGSDSIVVFGIDSASGRPSQIGPPIVISRPLSCRFVPQGP